MLVNDAARMIEERLGDPLMEAIRAILVDELERCKTSLLQTESGEMRGRGQQCAKLLKGFSPKVSVDNGE